MLNVMANKCKYKSDLWENLLKCMFCCSSSYKFRFDHIGLLGRVKKDQSFYILKKYIKNCRLLLILLSVWCAFDNKVAIKPII